MRRISNRQCHDVPEQWREERREGGTERWEEGGRLITDTYDVGKERKKKHGREVKERTGERKGRGRGTVSWKEGGGLITGTAMT